jgi:methyl-accepting chemotaxis protein/cytochrome b561
MTYSRPLRLIHWTVAILVTCQLAIAVVLTQLRSLSYGQLVLSLHRQIGLAILVLVLTRLVMSRRHKIPAQGSINLPPWQMRTATMVHGAFIVLLMVQPVIGVLVACGRGDSIGLLGLISVSLPIEMSDAVRERLMTVHAVTATLIFALVLLHVAAVLFNRIVRRVPVIDRMLPPISSDTLINRMSVGRQLSLAFALVIGAALLVGVNAVATYRDLSRESAAFQTGDVAAADQLRAAQVAWKDYALGTAGNGPGDAAHLKEFADSAKASLEDAQTHASAGDLKTALPAVIEQLTAAAVPGADARAAVMAVGAKLQDLVDSQAMVMLQHRTENDELAARGHDLIVVTVLPVVLAGLITGVLLARSFTGSLTRMAALIKSIEADRRDMNIHVDGSGEFAGLARDIISMRVAVESRGSAAAKRQADLEAERARLAQEQLHREAELERQQRIARQVQREQLASEFELQIAGIIGTVSDAAQALSSSATTMASSAAVSTQRSRDASAVAARTSESASAVAAGTGDLSAKAQAVRENAEQSKSRAGFAVQEAAQANAQIRHLVTGVQQISSITDLIAAVARQTHLLAINARIEAARAGDVGRGFSIVADEVKVLAHRTGEAAGGIEKQIREINAAAARSLEYLQRLLEVIAGVDQAASAIFEVTDAQVASTRQIAERVSEISSSTHSVATDIRDAQETVDATEQMSAEVVEAAALIGDQTDQLREQVARFVMRLRDAGSAGASVPPSRGSDGGVDRRGEARPASGYPVPSDIDAWTASKDDRGEAYAIEPHRLAG